MRWSMLPGVLKADGNDTFLGDAEMNWEYQMNALSFK